MRVLTTAVVAALVVAGGLATANGEIIRDFNAGIGPAANHPYPTAEFNTWYDITSDAFATPSAGTLDGSPALRIDDGGFTNGVYTILQSVIPATGLYRLEAAMKVVEPDNVPNGIRAYQIGAVVNGTHRVDHPTNPDDIMTINAADPGSGIGNYVGLTTGNDSGLATQIVSTDTFFAVAGDHLLVAFSTDLDTGNFDDNSAGWGTAPNVAHVLVDNLDLVFIPEPSTFVLAVLGLVGVALAARRRMA